MRNVLLGAGTSIVLAFVVIVPSVFGISTWKIALGVLGFVLIVLSGRNNTTRK